MFYSHLRGMKHRSRTAAVAGIIGLTLGLTACGGSSSATEITVGPPSTVDNAAWDKIVEEANKEGTVNYYFSFSSSDKIIADFQKAYPGIKVEATKISTADLVQKLDQELEADIRSADVAMHASPGWFLDRSDENKFASLSLSPDRASEGWEDRLGGKSYATVMGLPYTISSHKDQPDYTDVQSLLAAKPDAKFGFMNPHASVAAAFAYETLRQTFGDEILDQLAATDHVVEASNTPLSQALAAGAFQYALPGLSTTTNPLIEKGAPIKDIVPSKAASGAYYSAAVLHTAPHPNAGLVLANWLMSKEGQESYVKNISPVTGPLNVEGAIPWEAVKSYDPKEWTNDKWNAWIAEHWTPRFG